MPGKVLLWIIMFVKIVEYFASVLETKVKIMGYIDRDIKSSDEDIIARGD